jgi:hypothetical protein
VAQQGRVTLDRDFNALQGLADERIAADALAIVGPCGTPDDGFAISLPPLSPPGPPLWSPPGSLGPIGPQDFNFLISPGTMYAGGQRAVFPPEQAGQAITYSYYDQPDWIDPLDPVTFESPPGYRELVYLDLAEQEVSAVEDPDLLEVALGGPDTTGRVKLMRRVKREAVASADCAGAWQEVTSGFLQNDGRQFDPDTAQLEPVVRLQAGFTQDVAATGPCDPIATGGYLGADNQLIRVAISHSGSVAASDPARLLWGYDNASFFYRVTGVSPDGTMLTLAADPPDAFHIPQTGQLVEILAAAAVLGKEPDATDPTGARSILRVVAEAQGEVRRLTQPYGPVTPGDPTSYIVLNQPLGPDLIGSAAPLFLRVWQAELSFNPAGDTVALNDPASGASTGVQVTISLPPGGVAAEGAFWLLAVRPTTPQAVYPERLLTEPQPPDGPRRWVCPLAVIDWQAGSVTDCRCPFDNLVTLTKRPGSCCTVGVSPDRLGGATTLQSIIDRAAGLAASVTVCLAQGTYLLAQPLTLTSAHSNMIIESCGGGASLAAAADAVILISGASGLTLRGLDIAATPSASGLALGAFVNGAPGLTIERCSFQLAPPQSAVTQFIVAVGLELLGDCSGLVLRDCNFTSTIPITLTPTSTFDRLGRHDAPAEAAAAPAVTAGSPRLALQRLLQRVPRAAAAPAATFVISAGCLASAQLGDCRIEDNDFSGFTGAFVCGMDAGTARLAGNKVLDCAAGLWIAVAGYVPPSTQFVSGQQLQQIAAAIDQFRETGTLAAITNPLSAFPPPVGESLAPSSFFVTDNQIEAMPGSAQGSTALMILANRTFVQGQDTSASLLVAGNRLRTQSPQQGAPGAVPPTALLVIADVARCAVTGNLISYEQGGRDIAGDSLDIITNTGQQADLLAVTGNVLLGSTTLGQLLRGDGTNLPAPFNTWVPFNSFAQSF